MLRTSILMYLVLPWAQSGRSFCTNFDFTLVTTAQVMIGNGFCFIYVLETATKNAYEISSFPRVNRRKRAERSGGDEDSWKTINNGLYMGGQE